MTDADPERSAPRKVEFWPSRLIIGVTITVWALFIALVVWLVYDLTFGGPAVALALKVTIGALALGLAVVHIRGAYFSGPALVADEIGLIYRDASKVYGPIPWADIQAIELDPPQASQMIHLHLSAPVRRRSLIGIAWLVGDDRIKAEALSIPAYSVDNRPDAAYAALVALFEAARA